MKLPALFVLIGTSIIYFGYFYGDVFLNPNSYLFNGEGDGVKNYFTYAYFISNNSSFIDFEGMNYPFGEHFLYTDNHPILALILKGLHPVIPQLSDYSIGVINTILLGSILFSLVVTYELLREFKTSRSIAMIFSFGMVAMSPQWLRIIGGHLSLSYVLAIPLSWLLLLRADQKNNYSSDLILTLNNTFWLFIHAYLGIIVLGFQFLIQVLKMVDTQFKSRKDLFRFAYIVAPAILFFFTIALTDTHQGRTDNPSGFFLYNARPYDFLIPITGWLRSSLDALFETGIELKWEAWNYIGIANIILLVVGLCKVFLRAFENKLVITSRYKLLFQSFLAALLLLVFSTGFPFVYFPEYLDYFPLLKQFRALGRFSWPLFYVSFVISASVLEDIFGAIKYKIMIHGLFLLIALSFVWESSYYHRLVSESMIRSENLFDKSSVPSSLEPSMGRIDPHKYQGIITLPFYYYGSESYQRPRSPLTLRYSMALAYHTGIPLFNAALTRTSVEESKQIVQIVSPDFYPKLIKKKLPNGKPFLIIKTPNSLTENELAIVKKAEVLYSNKDIQIMELSYDSLFSNSAEKELSTYQSLKTLIRIGDFSTTDSTILHYNDFDKHISKIAFRGRGAYQTLKKGNHVIAEFPPSSFEEGREYDISMWMHNGEKDALNLWFRFLIIEELPHGGTSVTTIFPEYAETIYGNWSLVEGSFTVSDGGNKVRIEVSGRRNSKASFYGDDLLIKEKGVDVYQFDSLSNTLFLNNHLIQFDSLNRIN